MKEFFKRCQVSLGVEDLRRYARILLEDLAPVLEGHEIVLRLADSSDWGTVLSGEVGAAAARNQALVSPETGRLHLPVVYQDEPLALITATPDQGRAVTGESAELLPALVRLSLEKILLYKINITDRETGLNNEDYFRSYLRRHLEGPARPADREGRPRPLRLGEREEQPGLTVILAQVRDFERLTADYGRLEAARVLRAVADWLAEAGKGAACLARVDRDRLGLLLPREDPAAGLVLAEEVLDRARSGKNGLARLDLALGLASFPGDFGDEAGPAEGAPSLRENPADLLLAKAEAALHRAAAFPRSRVFTYRQVLEKGGQVVQVLPFNRVVVNLGRQVGAREGQSFLLMEADGRSGPEFKGEVVLFEVNWDFSLGEVVNLRSSLSRVEPGDSLVLSRRPAEEPSREGSPRGESLDQLLGILDHRGFMGRCSRLIEREEKFALLLIQVDGYDRHRTTMGHLESDRQIEAMFGLLCQDLPEAALPGRFSADSLAVFCPGLTADEAGELARTWRDRIKARHRLTASFGVAVFPCGPFSRQETPVNAQKALEHATFLGPASVAVFDSVSLNISGDKLFEAGDIEGALEEYNKGLELNPADLNLLNSLGVCHGYRREVDQALEAFDRVLELDPENLMAHYNRGFALALANRTREALDNFRRAALIAPANFDVLFHLGKMALELDLVEEAQDSFQRASRLEDRRPIVFRYLGQTLLKVGRAAEAVDAFKAAVRHDPEDAASLSQLGVLYLQSGADLDVALSLLRQSVELDPSNSLFRQRLARGLAASGDWGGAEKQYRRVLALGARSREVYFELAESVRRQGRAGEAREMYQASLEVDPEFKPAAEALAALVIGD
ncbi:MAG: tetratricopeptide repeat protein [Thermodesulfobacteriota bacterium]